jgi:cytochrome c biogenesis protein CcmG/thiol:disulfide interchange protein DsbE
MTETTTAPKRGVPVWAQIIIWMGLLGLLAVVAFGLRRAQQGSVVVGDTLPDFTVTFFDGYEYAGKTEMKLSDFKGKVVVLNFWASWCKPCEQEAAELEAAWLYYKDTDQVIFLGVDYTDTPTEANAYLKKFAITYPNSPDLGSRIAQLFRITGVPETYFIDQNGVLQYAQVGPFTSVDEIKVQVDALLKNNQ